MRVFNPNRANLRHANTRLKHNTKHTENTHKKQAAIEKSLSTCNSDSTIIRLKHGNRRSCIKTHIHSWVAQLGFLIVFTAVLAHPPSVFERFDARRVRLERLSLPLGSNFLIIDPPGQLLEPGLSSLRIMSSKALDRCLSLLIPLETDSKSLSNFILWFSVLGEE